MQSGREKYECDEWVDLMVNWNRFSYDFQYENHPDEITLDRYVHGATLSDSAPQMSTGPDVAAWLEGQNGWDASAISLHVLSCANCRDRVASLRAVLEREHVARTESWWQQIQMDPRKIWSAGMLRRSAIALVVVALLFSGAVVVDSLKPQNDGGTIVAHEGGMSTPDNSNSPVARLY